MVIRCCRASGLTLAAHWPSIGSQYGTACFTPGMLVVATPYVMQPSKLLSSAEGGASVGVTGPRPPVAYSTSSSTYVERGGCDVRRLQYRKEEQLMRRD